MLILNLHERTYNDKKKNIDLLNKMAEKVINKFNLDIDMSNKTILSQLYKEGAFLNTYDVTLKDPYLEEIYPKINDCGANKINIKEFLEALEVIKMLNYN